MTVQPSSFFVAALSAAALLLVSGNTTSAHSHKNNGPVINGPVHGPGSSHNPIVYHPVHGPGSTHNPIVHRTKPPICPGAGYPTCKPDHPPCPAGDRHIVNGQCMP
jgi:hypothetical protein